MASVSESKPTEANVAEEPKKAKENGVNKAEETSVNDSEAAESIASGETGPKRFGKVKWFNVTKGWGFIAAEDGSQDVFVHQSVIKMEGFRSLAEGERVEFEARQSEKGLEATVVTGPEGNPCLGSNRHPTAKKKYRKARCYNCGEFANHVAARCDKGVMPKRCHNCRSEDHLIKDCPLKTQKQNGHSEGGDSSAAPATGEATGAGDAPASAEGSQVAAPAPAAPAAAAAAAAPAPAPTPAPAEGAADAPAPPADDADKTAKTPKKK